MSSRCTERDTISDLCASPSFESNGFSLFICTSSTNIEEQNSTANERSQEKKKTPTIWHTRKKITQKSYNIFNKTTFHTHTHKKLPEEEEQDKKKHRERSDETKRNVSSSFSFVRFVFFMSAFWSAGSYMLPKWTRKRFKIKEKRRKLIIIKKNVEANVRRGYRATNTSTTTIQAGGCERNLTKDDDDIDGKKFEWKNAIGKVRRQAKDRQFILRSKPVYYCRSASNAWVKNRRVFWSFASSFLGADNLLPVHFDAVFGLLSSAVDIDRCHTYFLLIFVAVLCDIPGTFRVSIYSPKLL